MRSPRSAVGALGAMVIAGSAAPGAAGAVVAGPPFLFETPAHTAVGQRPTGVVAADMNGDGDLDLVTANRETNDVTVLLGDGAAGLTVAGSYFSGSMPRYVVAADFDRDCDVDVATVHLPGDSAKVLWNDGTGVLTAGPPMPFDRAAWLETLDLDENGWPDLIVAHMQPGTEGDEPAALSVLLNQSGTLVVDAEYEIGFWPRGGAVGDFDRDGHLDVVVITQLSHQFDLLLGDGNGHLTWTSSTHTGLYPRHAAASDFDGDGDLDLAVILKESRELRLFRNQGDATFVHDALERWSLPGEPHGIVAADLDSDGDADLAIAYVTADLIDVWANDGNGGLTVQSEIVSGRPAHVIAADLDDDGALDLVTVNVTGHTAAVLGNLTPQGPVGACPADVNGDGTRDVADLLVVLASWGDCVCVPDCAADLNGDAQVGVTDLLALLAAWGDCR